MISFTVRMEIREKDRQQIDESCGPLTQASRNEPGCVTYIRTA